jgi:hypothetical protein
MYQHADASDVSFPTSQLLVQRGAPENLPVRDGKERQVAPEVYAPAPIADDVWFSDAMFDEHPLSSGHAEEELVEGFFVVLAQGAKFATKSVLEADIFRELLECNFS